MVPDFSGKYHGKTNKNISRETTERISKKCNCRKKALTENYQSSKGNHTEKQRLKPAQKHGLGLDT